MVLRRMVRIDEATGIMLECTDKTKEVDERSLGETSFSETVGVLLTECSLRSCEWEFGPSEFIV